jgi:hypothetical protein
MILTFPAEAQQPTVDPDDAPGVTFHAALAHDLDATTFADVQARVRTRVLRTFVRRGLIDKDYAAEMRGNRLFLEDGISGEAHPTG